MEKWINFLAAVNLRTIHTSFLRNSTGGLMRKTENKEAGILTHMPSEYIWLFFDP
jgi:hypothetical protein